MMSQSRFVLKQIHVSGTGNSDLTRYIAKNGLDHEREGKNPRLLFSKHNDKLTYWEARKYLSITGGELRKDELLHYVLSFENQKEFELLGEDETKRRSEVVTYLRESLGKGFDSIGVKEMRWVAGVHRNKDNPHLHILFNKNVIEKKTGDLVFLAKLPLSVIAHYERENDGTKSFNYGLIINSFAERVDTRHRERVRYLQFEDPLKKVGFTRELLSPKTLQTKEPTPEEILIGRWIVEEIKAAYIKVQSLQAKDYLSKEKSNTFDTDKGKENLKLLREEVANIDRVALANGDSLTPAFIDRENLRSIIVNESLIANLALFEHKPPTLETHIKEQNKEQNLVHESSLEHHIDNTFKKQDPVRSIEKSLIIETTSFDR